MHRELLLLTIAAALGLGPVLPAISAEQAEGCAIPTLKVTITKQVVASPESVPVTAPAIEPIAVPSYPAFQRRVVKPPPVKSRLSSPQQRLQTGDEQANSAEVKAMAAMLEQYKHMQPGQGRPVRRIYTGPPLKSLKPRWGDKDCACHDAMRRYLQGRYMEAAAIYRMAAKNLLSAWGRPTPDVANALRGEAICYVAAGRRQDARPLLRQAAQIYIANGAAAELENTILDLCDTCKKLGDETTANRLQSRVTAICTLTKKDPARAGAEFNTLITY